MYACAEHMRTITKPVPLSVIVGWSVLRRGRPKPKPYSHATVLRTSVIDVAQQGRIFEGSKQKQQERFLTSMTQTDAFLSVLAPAKLLPHICT